MNRRSFIENSAPDLYLLRIVNHHLLKWRRSGRKWGWPIQKSINFLHEIDIPKCINVYSIYRTKLGVIGCFVLSFLICFRCMKLYCTFFYFTCMRGDTEKIKKKFPLNLYRQIQGLFCVVQYIDDAQHKLWCNWLIFLQILKALQNELINFCSVVE